MPVRPTAQPDGDASTRQALVSAVSGLALQAKPAGQASASSSKHSWLQCQAAPSWTQKPLPQSSLAAQTAPSAPGLGSGYRHARSSQRSGGVQSAAPAQVGEQYEKSGASAGA